MAVKHLYLNGNGVAFVPSTEQKLWEDVGFGLVKHYWHEKPRQVKKTARLLTVAAAELFPLGWKYKKGKLPESEYK